MITRREAVQMVGAATLVAVGTAAEAEERMEEAEAPSGERADELSLWYDRPAKTWLEALPVGNGRLGAMLFGGVADERLQLNEGTLWGGGPHDDTNPDALAALPEIRKRIFAGDWRGAHELVDQHFMSKPLRQAPYQTIGSLKLTFPGEGESSAYRRDLNLDSAEAMVRYTLDGAAYERTVFASYPDQVIVLHLKADRPGAIGFKAAFDSPLSNESTGHGGATLLLTGRNGEAEGIPGALRFAAGVRALSKGGSVTCNGRLLEVTGADEVTLLIGMATSYRSFKDVSGDPADLVEKRLGLAAKSSYAQLRRRHLDDYRRLFRRVGIELSTGDAGADHAAAMRPTNVRVAAFKEGRDPRLAALHFQFGRYLLISSSREGGQPATLQGLWNDSLNPPWGSKYTININTEMNYWPAATANLLECYAPLLRMLHDLSEAGQRTAKIHYGASGWVCHHNTNGWRRTAPIDGSFWGMWPSGGAWLCKSFQDCYDFTHDTRVLESGYPIMRGAAEFFLDALVEEPKSGHLVTCPSISPENAHHNGASLCAGPTMDMQILRDLFDTVDKAGELLGKDREFRARVRAARERLSPNRIGAQGQLQEWMEDWDAGAPEQQHRHVSHLYGLYPSSQISSRRTPELFAAARKSLEQRGDPATGWSLAWKINLWARLLDGNHAYKLLTDLLSPERTAPNLFDLHPPFQIDGNFGAVSGVVEMLLQSHDGAVDLLPALPAAWPDGHVRGLRARGGFEVSIRWSNGRLVMAGVRAARAGEALLRYRGRTRAVTVRPGGEVTWDGISES